MTYSIVARDPDTSELGVAVQSRYFAVGGTVPWIEAGVGVVATQSFTSLLYGARGLEMMRAGLEPKCILEKLVSEDPGESMRQVAIL
jgi:uncharacterized Ntn-hydrolase superfamily protein